MAGNKGQLNYFETDPCNIPVEIYAVALLALIYALRTPGLRDTALKLVDLLFPEYVGTK